MQPASGPIASKPWIVIGGALALVAVLVALLWAPSRPGVRAKELVLECAAGIVKPVEEIAAQYEKEYGVKVEIEPDASGALLSKLRVVQAPHADLFLSGDEADVRTARSLGLVTEILPVARQHVVVAVQPGNPQKIATAADLLRPEVSVVLPNPELAASGQAAKRALVASGQWEALAGRLKSSAAKVSLVGTVPDAAQKVKLRAAEAAIVWDATARQFGLDLVEIPEFQNKTEEQVTLGVVASTPQPTAALHFARYLAARDRGEPVFAKHYFQPIADADVWEDRPALVLASGAMLKPAIEDTLKRFSRREGVDINTTYNGCGILVANMKVMKQGKTASAHFPDAYFSCDVSFMRMVQPWFDAATTISRNDMVLAVPKGNPKHVRSIQDLTRPDLRLGLAHPVNSALGALTDALLKKLKLHDQVYAADRPHPPVHTDAGHMLVNQLRAGALDLIVVYRSNVLSHADNPDKDLEIVEMNLPEAIAIQPFAVAKDSRHRYLMRRLLEAILAPASRRQFGAVGFRWIAEEPSP
jgi:molybdenum ABC transporter molybdate-binding protein